MSAVKLRARARRASHEEYRASEWGARCTQSSSQHAPDAGKLTPSHGHGGDPNSHFAHVLARPCGSITTCYMSLRIYYMDTATAAVQSNKTHRSIMNL